MTVPDNVRSGETATAAWANQLLAVVRDLDAHDDLVSITRSGSQLVVTTRTGRVARIDLPAGGGTTLPAYTQAATLFLKSRNNILFWEDANEVPGTPGTQSGIGHVLTVRGENDQDYHWAPPPTGGGGGDTSGLSSRITTNANDIGELQRERTTDRQSIADNEGRITTAETDINNLESEDSTLAASIAGNTTAIDNEVSARTSADNALDGRIATNAGNIQTNSNLIAAVTRTAQSLVTEVDTLHPKIGRLVPITPWVRNDSARTLRFAWFPLAAVSTSDTLRMSIGGVAHTPRLTEGYAATDVSGIVLSVPVSASNAGSISRASNTIAGYVRVDLVMARANFHCYIPAEDPPSTGSGTTARTTVLTAIGSSTTSVTLPTDYAGYSLLEVEAQQSSGGTGTLIVPAGLLSGLSTATWTYASTQNGQTGVLSWNRSTRELSGDSSNTTNYAALTDGGPKGDKGDKGDRGDAGGLSTSQVDARFQTWGRAGNTSTIPDNKIPNTPNTCLLYTSPSPRDS